MTLNTIKNAASVFNTIATDRRSVRIFDTKAPFDHKVVTRSLEQAVLAPSSSNLQFWEFYRVIDLDKKEKLAKYCLNQKAATTAQELVVVVARPDKWQDRAQVLLGELKSKQAVSQGVLDYYTKVIPSMYRGFGKPLLSWLSTKLRNFKAGDKISVRQGSHADVRIVAHKSVALAAQNFMMALKANGYDSCPMEGMDTLHIKRMLKLPTAAEISMVIGVGKGLPEGIYGKRYRLPQEQVVFTV